MLNRSAIVRAAHVRRRPAMLAVVLLGALVACSKDQGPPPCIVSSLSVSPTTANLQAGATTTLTASVVQTDCNATTVTWSTSDPAVASLSSTTGNSVTVTAGTPGNAVVTASASGDQGSASNTATITVTPIPVATVAVSPATLTLQVGQSAAASAEARDASGAALSGRTITWQSSNPNVATVTGTGANVVINATGAGSAVVTATSEGKSGTVAVSVGAPVASVTVTPPTATVVAGGTVQFTATPRDAGGATLNRPVNWASSNTAVAEVSSTGLVTAKATGTATITATSENVPGTAAVTVVVPLAYAFANQPTSGQYTPPGRNFMGGSITATRNSTGNYTVVFGGMGASNPNVGAVTVMVNAVSASLNPSLTSPSAYCQLSSFSFDTGGNSSATVQCSDPTTFPGHFLKDSRFEVMVVGRNVFGGPNVPGQSAVFSVHNNTNATVPYAPLSAMAWNSAGASQTVGTLGGGVWRHTTGLNLTAPWAVMISTFGGEACMLNQGAATLVDVLCQTQQNTPGNSLHTVLQIQRGRPNAGFAYSFVANSAADPTFSLNPGGQILVTPQGTGRWSIAFTGLSIPSQFFIMVTPLANAWTACSHSFVNNNPVTVEVACFNASGSFRDVPFVVAVIE